MKITILSLGLAVLTLAAAQADPMAPNGAQTTYEWAQGMEHEDSIAQLERSFSQISELEFRAQFLARPDTSIQAEGGETNTESACDTTINEIKTTLVDIAGKLQDVQLSGFNAPNKILASAAEKLDNLKSDSANSQAAILAIDTVITMLRSIAPFTDGIIPSSVTEALANIKSPLAAYTTCNSSNAASSPEHSVCYDVADLYRAVIADVVANPPSMPSDASEDLQRYAAGAQAILQIISKSSIASSNEALLASRPIFAADLLDDYRTEIIRAGAQKEVQTYAAASLGFVVGSSNALEACLRIAANPVAAVDELNEELDALEDEDYDDDYNEEDDYDDEEDYDEDEDEDSDSEADAADSVAEITIDSQAEVTPAEPQAEATPAESQAEATPAESQAEATPAESQAEATPAESQAEVTVAESQAEATVAESQADATVAEPQAEATPAEPQAEATPAEPQAEATPAESQADATVAATETQTDATSAESQVDAAAEPQVDATPAESQVDATADASPVEPQANPAAADASSDESQADAASQAEPQAEQVQAKEAQTEQAQNEQAKAEP
ncbi:hypothetical protein FBU30_007548 [Linnemannia zychae]|nr:hypothetical protein FBU30_007548 [Linnemannia zychae]